MVYIINLTSINEKIHKNLRKKKK